MDPASHWAPLAGEFARGHGLSLPTSPGETMQRDTQHGEPGRPDTGDGFDLQTTARTIRSALRGGPNG